MKYKNKQKQNKLDAKRRQDSASLESQVPRAIGRQMALKPLRVPRPSPSSRYYFFIISIRLYLHRRWQKQSASAVDKDPLVSRGLLASSWRSGDTRQLSTPWWWKGLLLTRPATMSARRRPHPLLRAPADVRFTVVHSTRTFSSTTASNSAFNLLSPGPML